MIWRAFVFFDVITVGCYVNRDHGEAAAWAVMGVLLALLLPLSRAVSHLAKIEKLLTEERALLLKLIRGYAR